MMRNQIDKTAHFRQQCVCILLVNKLLQILKDTIQLTLEFILHPQAAAHRFNIQLHI